MFGITKVDDVYAAVEEGSRQLGVDCSREKVWPVLTAYQDAFPQAVIVLSMETGRGAGELDYSVTIPAEGVDPYTHAVANGLIEATDHPVGSLLSDLRERCPIGGYGIDVGVVGGFKKTYVFFPLNDLQGLAKLAAVPSMPPALAEYADIFTRHGVDGSVKMIGIDYKHRTANVYFGNLPAECLQPEAIRSMLHDLGLPEPSERTLEFARSSFSSYITMSWDSSKIERICYAVMTMDPMAIPSRIEPEIAKFAVSAPYSYAEDGARILTYGITVAPGGESYKLGCYYQMAPETWKLLTTFKAIKD